MGGDTIIVERLARDLSAEFGVLLAPDGRVWRQR